MEQILVQIMAQILMMVELVLGGAVSSLIENSQKTGTRLPTPLMARDNQNF